MIRQLLNEVISGINIIDIGCRGELNTKWIPVEKYINLFGFDPNEEECERMAGIPHNYLSVKYYPYAIAGYNGEATMYKTKSLFCYSLLRPDSQWLSRFSFHDHLEVVGEEPLKVIKLDSVIEFQGLDVDGLKIDAQGMELEILKSADTLLDNVFYAETESGFSPNYINESTQSQVDEFMRSNGFLLFDLLLSRMTHDNHFKSTNLDHAQLLWGESVWLKDYIRLFKENKLVPGTNINREKAIKILVICAVQQCIDYGFELASIFADLNLISPTELNALKESDSWRLNDPKVADQPESQNKFLNLILRLLPSSTRRLIGNEATIAAKHKHILKSI